MSTDPKILGVGLAVVGGIIPSFLWLWFWLQEDKKKPEPTGLLAACFLAGIISVALILPLEKIIKTYVANTEWQIIGWAGVEEMIKYLAVLLVLYKTAHTDQPIDWPIYFITTALGFAAIENIMFLIKPFSLNQAVVGLLTGQLRFLGATLLHTVASGIVGIAYGLSMNTGRWKRKVYVLIGLSFAIALHSAFNFFIMDDSSENIIKIFGFLWVVTIIIMLLFEKLRRMSGE